MNFFRLRRPGDRWDDRVIFQNHPYLCSQACPKVVEETSGCLDGKEYTVVNQKLPFPAAKADCESRGKVLAGITDLEEYNFVVDLADSLSALPADHDVWIGILVWNLY